jgi:hypothetical protein
MNKVTEFVSVDEIRAYILHQLSILTQHELVNGKSDYSDGVADTYNDLLEKLED